MGGGVKKFSVTSDRLCGQSQRSFLTLIFKVVYFRYFTPQQSLTQVIDAWELLGTRNCHHHVPYPKARHLAQQAESVQIPPVVIHNSAISS